MKSIPQTPKKFMGNWFGNQFQAILLIIFLIWTPLLIIGTLEVQHSCHPMINWDHPLPAECVPPQKPVVPPTTPKSFLEKLSDAAHKVSDGFGKVSEEAKRKVSEVVSKIGKNFRRENPSPTTVDPSSPEPNLIEKFKNLFQDKFKIMGVG